MAQAVHSLGSCVRPRARYADGDRRARAREFVFEAIRTAPKLGKGNGPLNHGLNMGEAEEKLGSQDSGKESPFAALKDLQT